MVPVITGFRFGFVDVLALPVAFIIALGFAEDVLFLRPLTVGALLAMGRPAWQVRMMLGKPRNAEGPISLKGMWPFARSADENWLYDSGASHTLVVSLKNGTCTHAEVYDYSDDICYQHWKAEQIGAYAKGRVDTEIFSKYGLPQFQTVDHGSYTESSLVLMKQQLGANGQWSYETGYSTAVQLTVENHRCIESERLGLWH